MVPSSNGSREFPPPGFLHVLISAGKLFFPVKGPEALQYGMRVMSAFMFPPVVGKKKLTRQTHLMYGRGELHNCCARIQLRLCNDGMQHHRQDAIVGNAVPSTPHGKHKEVQVRLRVLHPIQGGLSQQFVSAELCFRLLSLPSSFIRLPILNRYGNTTSEGTHPWSA